MPIILLEAILLTIVFLSSSLGNQSHHSHATKQREESLREEVREKFGFVFDEEEVSDISSAEIIEKINIYYSREADLKSVEEKVRMHLSVIHLQMLEVNNLRNQEGIYLIEGKIGEAKISNFIRESMPEDFGGSVAEIKAKLKNYDLGSFNKENFFINQLISSNDAQHLFSLLFFMETFFSGGDADFAGLAINLYEEARKSENDKGVFSSYNLWGEKNVHVVDFENNNFVYDEISFISFIDLLK